MGGPIVRTGTNPAFWANWDNVFGGKKGKAAPAAEKKSAGKSTAKKAATKAAVKSAKAKPAVAKAAAKGKTVAKGKKK